MAKDKKSFILYADQISLFEKLTDDEAGRLVKHIFSYVNDESPQAPDRLTEIAFEPIKQQLKRDLTQWESERKQRSEAGKKGMEKRWGNRNEAKQEVTDDNTVINSITNITDNVNVNVNVNETVSDNVKVIKNTIEDRKQKFALTLKPYEGKYQRQMLVDFYKYWTEPNKSNSKFKQELEKTWDLERRLETWARNDKQFGSNNNDNQPLKLSLSKKQMNG